MKITDLGNGQFSFSGQYPHCKDKSVFTIVSGPSGSAAPEQPRHTISCAAMQCQGCRRFILGVVQSPNTSPRQYEYVEHYPLGKPDDSVAVEIPTAIGRDFQEALRCRWVDAYNATVEMCRRAVQASCIDLKAPPDERLVKQIDWLADRGKITAPLKDMAHRVRLGGNLGAHPPEDPDDPCEVHIGMEYADAVIEFTREFFQHVYVMPERMKRFTFTKP